MKKRLDRVVKEIKNLKIQGATSIAKAALKIYIKDPTKEAKKKLINARPTEPMLINVINRADNTSYKKIISHFFNAQNKINQLVFKLINSGDVIYTHCHSTNVTKALIYAKKKRKKFEVYNTETRPRFQGRKTARELKQAGIKITMFVDSAMAIALEKKQDTKKVDKIFLGSDALLEKGAINKVGSGMLAELAKLNKIPLYIISDSWKYSPKNVKIEQRSFKEVWKNAPKKIKIKNPAFEFIDKKYIKEIVSELGVLSYDEFLEKVKSIS